MDGAFVLACANDRQFRDVCSKVIERPDLACDPRFATNEDRVRNRQILVPILVVAFATSSRAEIIAACRLAGVPVGRVQSVEEALCSSGTAERGMIVGINDGARVTNSPIRFAQAPMRSVEPPPRLGEHTDDILSGVLGYSSEALLRLRNAKIIA